LGVDHETDVFVSGVILSDNPATMTKPHVTIYSDGGAKPNPNGPGGWAALLISDSGIREISGRAESTTNNRMELTAAIEALDALSEASEVEFHTDSQYVKNGISEWLAGWVRKGWKTAGGEPVKNQDLWERLHRATQRHTIRWNWVKGHATSVYNNRVDELATAAREGVKASPAPAREQKPATADASVYVYAHMAAGGKRGGWCAVVVRGGEQTVYGGSENPTSSNQLVLIGCAQTLEKLNDIQSCVVQSDSEYLINGMSKWLAGWMKKGWKTASGDPVKNQDLWKRLHEAARAYAIEWQYLEKFEDGYAKQAAQIARENATT